MVKLYIDYDYAKSLISKFQLDDEEEEDERKAE